MSACLLYKTWRCSKVISLVKKYKYKKPNYTIWRTHSLETKQYRKLTLVPRSELGTEKPILDFGTNSQELIFPAVRDNRFAEPSLVQFYQILHLIFKKICQELDQFLVHLILIVEQLACSPCLYGRKNGQTPKKLQHKQFSLNNSWVPSITPKILPSIVPW